MPTSRPAWCLPWPGLPSASRWCWPPGSGLARFTELDEKFAFAAIAGQLRAARDAGRLRVEDPDTLARLFLGALTRGSMLIAASSQPKATRDEVARAVRALLQGLSA